MGERHGSYLPRELKGNHVEPRNGNLISGNQKKIQDEKGFLHLFKSLSLKLFDTYKDLLCQFLMSVMAA